MNISSVLIVAKTAHHEALCEAINKIKHCSVELVEEEKIIVVIESENLNDELAAYKALEALKNTSAVSMVFSYQDLDEDIKNIKGEVPKKLQDNVKAEDIEYYGEIFEKY